MVRVQDTSPAALVSQWSWRTLYARKAMIEVNIPSPKYLQHDSGISSSAGVLDTLPLELLHLILELLDFQSLYNVVHGSRRCRVLVEALPAYRETSTHAPSVLAAMKRTKLLSTHSAACIHTALRSESCTECNEYGPFLFLPISERCCLNCLRDDLSLRVSTIPKITKRFGITRNDLTGVPIMQGIPGEYRIGFAVTHKTAPNLVSVKQAKMRATAIHGSEHAMQTYVTSRHTLQMDRYTQRASNHSGTTARLRRPTSPSRILKAPNDPFCGMASTAIPSLRGTERPEHGLWCLGCHALFDRWVKYKIPDGNGGNGEDDSVRMRRLYRRECRAWSRSDFLIHIKECEGSSEQAYSNEAVRI
ncbi:hypothetical protein EV356DRAFT_76351 [Viridothelium virens]|uniref:F-box domain-containing protein n=1 Tax=Viridothelium virens TaxID=1048519 RepID=A0A6A6HDZ7_VIRVR|nr:hypothetical protein EV356DRAFT_76351 [Viridothelium virens]